MRYSDDEGGSGRREDEDLESTEVGGVTITGAHLAVPPPEDAELDFEAPPPTRGAPADPELPHWTEAPTGQVPAVLARDDESVSDDPWSSLPQPNWREHESDWTDEEQRFEPAMLGDEPGTEREETSRRPWEFDAPAVDDRDGPTLVGGTATPAGTGTGTGTGTRSAPATRVRARETRVRRPDGPMTGRAARPPSTSRDMRLAVLTGLALGVLVLVVFNLSTVISLVVAAAAVTLAAGEAFNALRVMGHRPAAALGLVACLALMVATYNKGVTALPLVTALLFGFTFLWYVVGVERAEVVDGMASTVFVFVWVGVLGSFAALLLAPSIFPNKAGIHFVLGTIIVVVANDLSALVIGKLFGRRAMAPSISPNKTWEGAIGAGIVTILAGACVSAIPHWTLASGLTLGIAAAVLAPLGDLCESMVKRSLGLKDIGNSLPGHGGMLDRVDGMLFVLPAAYYVVLAYHLH